jgi:hypothetical protein
MEYKIQMNVQSLASFDHEALKALAGIMKLLSVG